MTDPDELVLGHGVGLPGRVDAFAHTRDDLVVHLNEQADDLVVLEWAVWDLRQSRLGGDSGRPSVGCNTDRGGAFSDEVAGRPCSGDCFVELKVKRTEMWPVDVPVSLLGAQRKIDDVDQSPLKRGPNRFLCRFAEWCINARHF